MGDFSTTMIVTSQPASLYGELRVGGWVPPTSWAVRPFKVGQRAPFNPDEHDPLCSFSHLDVRDPSGVPNRPRRQLCVILGRGPSSRTTSRVCVCVFLSRSTLPRLCFALTGSVRRAPRNDILYSSHVFFLHYNDLLRRTALSCTLVSFLYL